VHSLGEGAVVRGHRGDAVERGLEGIGLLGPLLPLSAQLGGALLHGGALLGAETVGLGRGLRRHDWPFLSGIGTDGVWWQMLRQPPLGIAS
jgi:hypothetical protein